MNLEKLSAKFFIIFRLNVYTKTASKYFRRCDHVPSVILEDFIKWPDKEVIVASTSQCFREAFGTKTTVNK